MKNIKHIIVRSAFVSLLFSSVLRADVSGLYLSAPSTAAAGQSYNVSASCMISDDYGLGYTAVFYILKDGDYFAYESQTMTGNSWYGTYGSAYFDIGGDDSGSAGQTITYQAFGHSQSDSFFSAAMQTYIY